MNNVNKIMDTLNKINYGFIDDNGINILDSDKNLESSFSKIYHLMSPEELLKKKYGVCWDQVELERKLFADCTDFIFKTYFIYIDDKNNLPSHTFLTYEDNKMYYWFEHSWNDEKGIHEYNNMNKLLNDVENKFKESHKEELIGKYKTYIYEYEQPNYNISCDQFYNFIFKQRKIYNYQLIDSTKEDEDRLKNYKLKSIIDYAKDISKNEIKQINSYIEENIPKQIDEYKNIIYNNEIIGSVLVNKIEKGLLIDEIFIEKEYRNKGIGSSIIKTIIANSNLDLYLWVYKENIKALNLYESIGFCIEDETNSRYFMKFLK